MKDTKQKLEELYKAAEPLVKYLSENYHPHVTANVTSTSVELVEGLLNIPNFYAMEGASIG